MRAENPTADPCLVGERTVTKSQNGGGVFGASCLVRTECGGAQAGTGAVGGDGRGEPYAVYGDEAARVDPGGAEVAGCGAVGCGLRESDADSKDRSKRVKGVRAVCDPIIRREAAHKWATRQRDCSMHHKS